MEDTPAYCASLDFAKCFDNLGCRLALRELALVGIPQGAVRALEGMWTCQERYFSSGAMLRGALVRTFSLPQG
eukprot:14843248-Alexandrium_andersonii.AAC.2